MDPLKRINDTFSKCHRLCFSYILYNFQPGTMENNPVIVFYLGLVDVALPISCTVTACVSMLLLMSEVNEENLALI